MNNNLNNNYQIIREWLSELPPLPAHRPSEAPELENIYTPSGHETALDPERILVVGGRGVGKSFWAAALLANASRQIVAEDYPKLKLHQYQVALGFAEGDSLENNFPSEDVITELITVDGFTPENIWRAVILHAVRAQIDLALPSSWRGDDGLVAWVAADAERMQNQFRLANQQLQAKNQRQLVIFDGLDRLANNWPDIRERTRGLMRVALAMQAYSAIKLKIFMRVDQADDAQLWNFPDASKIKGGKVDLRWQKRDLFGLLFALLSKHEPPGNAFTQILQQHLKIQPKHANGILRELMNDEDKQEEVFNLLAGKYMGSDKRRGKTYSWLHNHLADTYENVSPRSFLVAIRIAAMQNTSVDKVLEPKGLQKGIQVASEHRFEQLREDFFWIRNTLEPLAEMQVPCPKEAIYDKWQQANTLQTILDYAANNPVLLPVEFDAIGGASHASLLDALKRLGVAETRPDNRINVPDIYRVAAKLLKKGGIKAAN